VGFCLVGNSCQSDNISVLILHIFVDDHINGPHVLSTIRPDPTKPNPKSGVVQMEWNLTGNLLLVRFGVFYKALSILRGFLSMSTPDNIPSAVYIFEFPVPPEIFTPRLRTVLLHSQPVLHARWNPVRKGNLALCCGNQSVYTWSDEWQGDSGEEEMAECIGVPASTSDFKGHYLPVIC